MDDENTKCSTPSFRKERKMNSGRYYKIRAITILTVCTIVLSACQSGTTGMANLNSVLNTMPREKFDDTCAPLRAPFQKIRSERDKVIGANIVGGVIAGALLVAAMGGDTEDYMKGALAGGLVGAAKGYWENARSRGATERSLAKFANADARKEAAQNDNLVKTLLRLNACRLDQAERIAERSRNGEISIAQAKSLLAQVKKATRKDNSVVNSIAGSLRSYRAYVGVLDAKDIAAANRTRKSVASYKPNVRKITRTSRGKPGIDAGELASGSTDVARSRNGAARLGRANDAHVETVDDLINGMDLGTGT